MNHAPEDARLSKHRPIHATRTVSAKDFEEKTWRRLAQVQERPGHVYYDEDDGTFEIYFHHGITIGLWPVETCGAYYQTTIYEGENPNDTPFRYQIIASVQPIAQGFPDVTVTVSAWGQGEDDIGPRAHEIAERLAYFLATEQYTGRPPLAFTKPVSWTEYAQSLAHLHIDHKEVFEMRTALDEQRVEKQEKVLSARRELIQRVKAMDDTSAWICTGHLFEYEPPKDVHGHERLTFRKANGPCRDHVRIDEHHPLWHGSRAFIEALEEVTEAERILRTFEAADETRHHAGQYLLNRMDQVNGQQVIRDTSHYLGDYAHIVAVFRRGKRVWASVRMVFGKERSAEVTLLMEEELEEELDEPDETGR